MNFCPNGMTVYSSHELTVFEPRQQQNCDGIITNQSENKLWNIGRKAQCEVSNHFKRQFDWGELPPFVKPIKISLHSLIRIL